jgi:hypothetical protein
MKEVIRMFVIKDTASGIYFSNKNRVILFEDPSLAADFANAFMQFALQEMASISPFGIPQVMKLGNTIKIIEPDFDIEKAETITFHDLCDRK